MTDLTQFTQALIEAHRARGRFDPEGMDLPATRAEARALQGAVMETLGPVAGYKIGAQDEEVVTFAAIPQARTYDTGSRVTARDRLAVELEVGFELLSALPGTGIPDALEEYFRPRVALELVDTRLTGPLAQDPVLKLADFQLNEGLVRGTAPDSWDGSDFGTVTVHMTANSTVVVEGEVTVPGGSALTSLRRCLRTMADLGLTLEPGQMVITGSLCGVPWFDKGTEVLTRIETLGTAAITID
ncbi:hydratase [Pseudooceanicola nanhaiensis]|uniref:hydratase n=1 Tax=Pseudooceanicola nanhaiensis TaxID=375761 RepID=UPI001CD2B5F8|nr:hydratase [Pseudooceanicola nanhaiensis]MCA0922168.1 hydratase [Pseudooceanicola nanhaiensis]